VRICPVAFPAKSAQLPGTSHAAGRFLRAIGKPAFIATSDVVAALIREGVVDRLPSSKRDLAAVQAAFNQWSNESDRDLTAISRILAMSVESDGASPPGGGSGRCRHV
jgi:hypothetical protein